MIELDLARRQVKASGKVVPVTPKGFKILKMLATAEGRVVSRASFLKAIWGYEDEMQVDTRTIDNHISRLRRLLGKDGAAIVTASCEGYQSFGVEIVSSEKPRAKILGIDRRTNQVLLKLLGGTVNKGQVVTLC